MPTTTKPQRKADRSAPTCSAFRCQNLDGDGKRCRKKATWSVNIWGDSSIHWGIPWVTVNLCGEHASAVELNVENSKHGDIR